MKQHKTILLVGCGNMGKAMAHAFLAAQKTTYQIHIVDPYLQSTADFPNHQADVFLYSDRDKVPQNLTPDYVIFAIKPQIFQEIVPLYQNFTRAIFLSILSGIQLERFEQTLGNQAKIIRFMPNLPMMIGQGAIAGFMNRNCTDSDKRDMESLFEKAGLLAWLDDEAQFDAVTALSGSGPGFIFALAESMIAAGIELGLSPALSESLTKQTLMGASCLLTESDKSPATLRQNVTSPKGTTEAGLSVLCNPDTGLANLILETLKATKNRSIELSKS